MNTEKIRVKRDRAGERGAALVMMLLISMLLLAAGGALIMTTANSTANTADATAEIQAYYGAEAGLQAAVNVLRGNRAASPALTAGQKINFRRAITLTDSNDVVGGDTSTFTRLSRWLPYTSDAPGTRVNVGNGVSYSIRVEEPPGVTTLPITEEPPRLLVTATGYGPKGATKELQMLIGKGAFAFDPPGTITVVGCGGAFSLGDSNASGFSGNDLASPPEPSVAAVAVSPCAAVATQTTITTLNASGGGTQVTPAVVEPLGPTNTPDILESPDEARKFLYEPILGMKDIAISQGRYFTTQAAANAAGGLGTNTADGVKFTFIDNYGGAPVTLGSGFQGNGLLIVTGNIDTDGNTDFRGVILAMGSGVITRSGGGNGVMQGSLVTACFDRDDPTADTFCAPTYNVSGGGTSNTQFNSVAIEDALNAVGRAVLGVIEK